MEKGSACSSHHAMAEREKAEQELLNKRMGFVKHKILVLSGKGGVGKSTVAVNLAVSLALAGKRVGLLDIDVHGPSVPKLLHLEGKPVEGSEAGILPVEYTDHLKVMSIGFLMPEGEQAVIWRGPMKHGVIRQFLAQTLWGELDYLVVDSPPGTGDEPLSIAQFLAGQAKAVVVTTPQEVALSDVRKSILFCRKLDLPVLGVVENMSGFVCPHCGKVSHIFKSGGGEEMAKAMEVPFLGRVPMDPDVVASCDAGEPYVDRYKDSPGAEAFKNVVKPLLEL